MFVAVATAEWWKNLIFFVFCSKTAKLDSGKSQRSDPINASIAKSKWSWTSWKSLWPVKVAKNSRVTTKNAPSLYTDWTCGNVRDARRIGEKIPATSTICAMWRCFSWFFRVIQQRAGEWLLRQLNQMKDTEDGNVELKKENILNVESK